MKQQIIIGEWIQATGTVISAINPPFVEDNNKILAKIGNILQAGGNAIVSDYTFELLSKLASEIQSIGNLFVFSGLFRENVVLEIKGNLIQALGAGLALKPALKEKNIIDFQGHLLQAIGNSLQAIAGSTELTKKIDASQLDFVGAWIQAVGSVITAIHATVENINKNNVYFKPAHVTNSHFTGQYFYF